jgi:predicted RecB family nuclease
MDEDFLSAEKTLISIRQIGPVRQSLLEACGICDFDQLYRMTESWKPISNVRAVEEKLTAVHGNLWRQKMGGSYLTKIIYSAKAIIEKKPILLEPINLPKCPVEFYVDLEYEDFPFCIGVKIVNGNKIVKFQRLMESENEAMRAISEFKKLTYGINEYVVYTWAGQDSRILGLKGNNIDLYYLINRCLMLPMKSFNVKEVAVYFGHKSPPLKITDGFACLLTFGQYLQTKDSSLRQELRKEIEDYNWNDVAQAIKKQYC